MSGSVSWQVYCVELFGSGRSTRKAFQPKDPDVSGFNSRTVLDFYIFSNLPVCHE